MSGFSAEWLALRESADAQARSSELVSFVARAVGTGRCLDLGGGTGANVRYLSSRLSDVSHWLVVDDEPALLSCVPAGVATRCVDLTVALDDDRLFRGCGLVTASALLDLVSERWLARLVERISTTRAAVLFALSYDGRIDCTPREADDDYVRRLVNEHQLRDKSFGPALGPGAAARAASLLEQAGYDVRQRSSDWDLGPDSAPLQRELIRGWAAAAFELAPNERPRIAEWHRRRLALVEAHRSRVRVGHVDVAGVHVA